MAHPEHPRSCALLQDSNPEAILLASSLPAYQIRSLLDSAFQRTELHAHIIQASELLEYFGSQIAHMKTWKCMWEDLCTETAVSDLEKHCHDAKADACRYDVEGLKKTVLGLDGHSRDAEALLTALMFRLLSMLYEFEILLGRYETRAEVSRLHLLVQHELSSISLYDCDDAMARIAKAGSMLDHLIELSREPVPESWIDEVESMEGRVANISVADAVAKTPSSSQSETRTCDVEDEDTDDHELRDASDTRRHIIGPVSEQTQMQELSGRQELHQEAAVGCHVEAQKPHNQEQAEGDSLVPTVSRSKDEENLHISKGREGVYVGDSTPPHIISQSAVGSPSSSTSAESSHEDDSTDPTEGFAAYTRASPVATTAKSPNSKSIGACPETEPLENGSDAQLPVASRIGPSHCPTSPIGTLETTEDILAEKWIQRQNAKSQLSTTVGDSGADSSSPTQLARHLQANSIDNEYPHQQREILDKDRYRGRNVRSGHGQGSLPSAGLDENDPKRLSMDVLSLRGTLAATKVSNEATPMSPQHTLDLKIQHILTTLPTSYVNIEPAEQLPAPVTNSSTYKLMKSSLLQEAGYGQTRKYLLQRPNAPPQVIWVRIVAERVMVRVGGGWTDLAEWLSNYILYHASRGSPLNVADPGAPNSKLTPSPRSTGVKVDTVSNRGTSRSTPSPSPGFGSRFTKSSPRTSLSGTSRGSSNNSSTNTPTPLGMAGPASSLAKGKMSNEKKAWVQKMLRQAGVGEPSREDKDVSRQLFVSEDK
ncbi:hypothetical protein V1525DRAFT_391007 [Lipomyces kononenkoae]|uniref:Uncharacterized protein n=1 Tax=Lipomyces kononenkoae TaxID=34357 RepID=A0ACC3SVQ7_LIPKO